MNITIIIGWVLAFGLTVFGIMNGGQFSYFVDIPSVAITLGGTLGGLVASFPPFNAEIPSRTSEDRVPSPKIRSSEVY